MDVSYLSEIVKQYWNAWELRTLILLSLLLQILLVVLGNRRKYMTGRWLRVFVGLAYLSADWVAIFSLGELARSQGTVLDPSQGGEVKNSANPKFIPLFWAPALLVHLGGPDTITAYAMKDTEFEIGSLLKAITQVLVVIYVFIKLWSKDNLPFVAISIFFVGFYKYVERIWVAISKKFGAAVINEMDAEPSTGIDVQLHSIDTISEAKFLYQAHMLLQMFKGLLSNLFLSYSDVGASRYIISSQAEEIFKLIEVELGLAYDVLYTKITGVQFSIRIGPRLIGFLLTISALVVFSTTINELHFSAIDVIISYILLVGAIVLETYSIMVFLFSDWTFLWIAMQNKACAKWFYRAIWSSRLRSFFNNDNKRWSGLMAQHDLLIATQLRKNLWDKFLVVLVPEGAKIQGWREVRVDLKQLILNRLLQRSRTDTITNADRLRTALEERGSEALRRKNCFGDFNWSVVYLEFHQSVLVWHIATSICYWDEFHKGREPGGALDPSCIISQSLSNYMMYLLVEYPLMLPKGISGPRYRATKLDMMDFLLYEREPTPDLSDSTSWDGLYKIIQYFFFTDHGDPMDGEYEDFLVQEIKKGTSALYGGLVLARLLQRENFESIGEKWERIRDVWVEMLIYAAGQCEWKEHAQALTRGGELIALVSLLKAHLGLTLQRSSTGLFQSSSEEMFDKMVKRLTGTEQSPSLTEPEIGHAANMA